MDQILEGMIEPRVKMTPEFWELISSFKRLLSASRNPDRQQSTTELRDLAMFPVFIQNPESHLPDIAVTYMQLKTDAQKVKWRLDQFGEAHPGSFSSMAVATHARVQAAYAMLSTLAVMLNTLLRVFDPCNPSLMSEALLFCDEIAIQAERASCYRPVGSAYIPLCLVVAWAASDNLVQLARIESILVEYQADFAEIPWMSRAKWLASTLDNHRMRLMTGKQLIKSPSDASSQAGTGNNTDATTKSPSMRAESCCIL